MRILFVLSMVLGQALLIVMPNIREVYTDILHDIQVKTGNHLGSWGD
jgi:hypothetical protein